MNKDEAKTVQWVFDKLKENQTQSLEAARISALSALHSGKADDKATALKYEAIADAFKLASDIVSVNLIQPFAGKITSK